MATVSVSIKILSGDMIDLDISKDVTLSQFYNIVWMALPIQIPLQSLDLFRQDYEEPLPQNDMSLTPQSGEIFLAFVQKTHFTLSLDIVADAFCNYIYYNVFNIIIHENEILCEESKDYSFDAPNAPNAPNYLPLTQDGNCVKSTPYNRYCIKIFTRLDQEEHQVYDEYGITLLNISRSGDWTIDVPEDKQPCTSLIDIFRDLPISTRTIDKMCDLLQTEIDEFKSAESERYAYAFF